MAMGTRRRRQRQERLWISLNELPKGPARPFYMRENALLEADRSMSSPRRSARDFTPRTTEGRPLTPGTYFRLLGVTWAPRRYFKEGIEKSPDSAKFRYHHGLTLMATGQKSKRRAQLETALRLRLGGSEAQQAQRALDRAD